MRRSSVVLPQLFCLAVAATGRLAAQGVVIAPHTIFIDNRVRSAAVELYNPGTDPIEADLSIFFGYPVSDSAGQFELRTVEAPDSTLPSAAGWIQAFPRKIIIGPQRTQTVRLLGRPPANLPDGEYWARLKVSAMAGQVPVQGAPDDTAAVQVRINLQVNTVLPVLYRKGAVSTGVRISQLSMARLGPDSLAVHASLEREGNAAFLGTLRAAVVDSAGQVMAQGTVPMGVYFTMEPRLLLSVPRLPAGRYMLRVELASEREDLPATSLLQIKPVVDSLEVTLP
jgi:P pilus assembly chaperone PapD